jgi:hypothetical protein
MGFIVVTRHGMMPTFDREVFVSLTIMDENVGHYLSDYLDRNPYVLEISFLDLYSLPPPPRPTQTHTQTVSMFLFCRELLAVSETEDFIEFNKKVASRCSFSSSAHCRWLSMASSIVRCQSFRFKLESG